MTQTVSQTIATQLANAGIKRVYGLPGGENVYLLAALKAVGIQFILVHNEASAVYMADADARLTGNPGVCLTTLGPGIANAMAGIGHAYLDRAPVIILAARMFQDWADTHTHQTIDQMTMLEPVTKAAFDVTADNVDEAMATALTVTMSERPGPVYLQISKQVANSPVVEKTHVLPVAEQPSIVDPAQLAKAHERLRGSKRPIIIAGLGLEPQAPYAALLTLAESLNAPIITTPKAKGALPASHPLAAGTLGVMRTDAPYELLAESDCIIGVGFDVVELVRPWDETAPFIWIAPWQNTDPQLPTVAELVGDQSAILRALSDGLFDLDNDWGAPRVKQFWTDNTAPLPAPATGRLNPQTVLAAIHQAVPQDTLITTDVGSHKIMTAIEWPATAPNRYMLSNGLSSMGFGLPAAIAASISLGNAPTISIMGDGGFSMIIGELELITRLGTPVIIVVMNDSALDLIRSAQTRVGNAPFGTEFGNPDFVKIAEAYDIKAVRAHTKEAITASVTHALEHNSPILIEALIDPASYPTTPK